jgi:hypothetical protein
LVHIPVVEVVCSVLRLHQIVRQHQTHPVQCTLLMVGAPAVVVVVHIHRLLLHQLAQDRNMAERQPIVDKTAAAAEEQSMVVVVQQKSQLR